MSDNKQVIVTKDSFRGWEEYYEAYFSCPKCGYPIMQEYKYCPDCGTKLTWKVEE